MGLKIIKEERRGVFMPEMLYGLGLSWVSNTEVSIAPGKCREKDDTRDLKSADTITINISTDLDTGSEAENTWYYVYLVYDEDSHVYDGLFSISSTGVALGSFTHQRLVGSVRNGPDGNFLKFRSFGNTRLRTIYYLENNATVLRVLAAGTATTYADIDCSALIPGISGLGIFYLHSKTHDSLFRTKGETMIGMAKLFKATAAKYEVPVDSNQKIQYELTDSGGQCNVSVLGYMEEL